MKGLTLVVNPGSASRRYGLFKDDSQIATLHFENEHDRVICLCSHDGRRRHVDVSFSDLGQTASHVLSLLRQQGVVADEPLEAVVVRVMAPGAFFLEDHIINDDYIGRLKESRKLAPFQVDTILKEVRLLREKFPDVTMYGISDSRFHATKPDFAWNYGIRLEDADRLDVKRFGYQGVSVASVINTLHKYEKLPPRVVVCHLGSHSSVTAVYHGKSFDTTMGYSSVEGVIMATQSGSIDPAAVHSLRSRLDLSEAELGEYLSQKSGLLGLSGISSDIRALLQHEANGHHYAGLALKSYVHSVVKAIGQMAAAVGGVDVLVFTGSVGEKSFVIRERIVERLNYLDLMLDGRSNHSCENPTELTCISRLAHSRPIFVISTDEAGEMLRRASKL